MEGVERVLHRFNQKLNCMETLERVCVGHEVSHKALLGKRVDVRRAISPDLIRWENLGVSRCNQLLWTMAMYAFAFLTCASAVSALYFINQYTKDFNQKFDGDCNEDRSN